MVTQEGAPSLGGRPGSLDHVLRDTGLSDFKAEFEQLAMDTGGAPQRIVSAHPSDQRAQVHVDFRPTSKGAGFPSPISPETFSRFGHAINTVQLFGTHNPSASPRGSTPLCAGNPIY